jgi:glycosyltransferase involved in cell wall biosynthesis
VANEASIWVGELELEGDADLIPVSGPVRSGQVIARVIARLHGAPVGYVHVPLGPAQTLAPRVRAAAERELAEPLRRHLARDAGSSGGDGDRWAARVGCPGRAVSGAEHGVSVIICSRDRPAGLLECLRTLQRVDYEPLEIIVVDNAPSDDATKHAVATLGDDDPRVRYTYEPRPGLSRARNHGLSQASYDYVAFTDDDVFVDRGWPAAIATGFAADPEAMCVTGLVASRSLDTAAERYFDSRYSWGEAFEPRRYDLHVHRDHSRLYPYSAGIFGTGANFAVRRSAMRRLGEFDPLLGAGSPARGGEDLDIFVRVILAGGRICYLPSALIWHQHRADNQALAEQVYAYGHGLGAYLTKRLIIRDMPVSMLARGFGQSAVVAGRMRQATQASQYRSRGKRLALSEAWGVVAGACTYYRTARRARD